MTNKIYPKVSIVTPSFNQGQFLEQTIESVLNQKYPNLEYIIIDGGSSDNSVSIIKKYENKLFYWLSEKDNGQSDAINKGFRIATGKYFNWLNSDDVLMDGALFRMVNYLENNPEIDIVFGNSVMIDENGNVLSKRYEIEYDNKITLYAINYLPQPSALMRSSIFSVKDIVNTKYHYCMDHELWIRLYLNGHHFKYLDEFFSGYRVHHKAKGFSGLEKKISKERNHLKRIYGIQINNIFFEYLVYGFLFLFYRLKRKIKQVGMHKKSNVLPFHLKVSYFKKKEYRN